MSCYNLYQHLDPFFFFLLGLFSMIVIFASTSQCFMFSMSILSSSIILKFYNLFISLIAFTSTLKISIPLMLQNGEFILFLFLF
jgi:hypothetical protein